MPSGGDDHGSRRLDDDCEFSSSARSRRVQDSGHRSRLCRLGGQIGTRESTSSPDNRDERSDHLKHPEVRRPFDPRATRSLAHGRGQRHAAPPGHAEMERIPANRRPCEEHVQRPSQKYRRGTVPLRAVRPSTAWSFRDDSAGPGRRTTSPGVSQRAPLRAMELTSNQYAHRHSNNCTRLPKPLGLTM